MSRLPWCAWYPSDFIAGVQGMGADQIGVYSVLLNMMYARRSKLAPDKVGLARSCGVSTRRFNQIVAGLVAMPNKLTIDNDGNLSNPRFEKWLQGQKDDPGKDEKNTPQNEATSNSSKGLSKNTPHLANSSPKTAQKNDSRTLISNLSRDKSDLKCLENRATLNKNNSLEATPRARARPRNHIEVSSVHATPKAAPSGRPPAEPESQALGAHTMDENSFNQWLRAIHATIPRGWSKPKALRRWLKMRPTDVDVLVHAWRMYLDDCAEKTKGSRYPQRTMYPENWIRDRIYESFVDLATANLKRESELNTARAKTLEQYNGHAKRILDAIGKAKFDAWLIGSRLVAVTEHEFIIATPRAFAARYINEHDALLRLIGKALGGKVTVQLEAAA